MSFPACVLPLGDTRQLHTNWITMKKGASDASYVYIVQVKSIFVGEDENKWEYKARCRNKREGRQFMISKNHSMYHLLPCFSFTHIIVYYE